MLCNECVPMQIYEYQQARIKQQGKIYKMQREFRKNILVAELAKMKLELRSDSKLCQLYINRGSEDIKYVVRRMCEMKYLFEYCNLREKIGQLIQEYGGHFPGMLEKAERQILKTRRYPEIFPWML